MKAQILCAATAFVAGLAVVPDAQGATLPNGTYSLLNHPSAAAVPPPYGLRLDELFDATAGHDVFTFDFNAVGSDMRLTWDGTSVHIFGTAIGGRDIGGTYAADIYFGAYDIDFTYSVGVGILPGDDDIWAAGPGGSNAGTITGPGILGSIDMVDRANGGFTFRLGDENSDAGHRGFPGISGWGWVDHGNPPVEQPTSDWLFIVGGRVPTPGTGVLALGAFALLGRRRR